MLTIAQIAFGISLTSIAISLFATIRVVRRVLDRQAATTDALYAQALSHEHNEDEEV